MEECRTLNEIKCDCDDTYNHKTKECKYPSVDVSDLRQEAIKHYKKCMEQAQLAENEGRFEDKWFLLGEASTYKEFFNLNSEDLKWMKIY